MQVETSTALNLYVSTDQTFFLNCIINLRSQEEILLHTDALKIDAEEELLVEAFLKKEYHTEIVNSPATAPAFVSEAVACGDKVIYFAAQLPDHTLYSITWGSEEEFISEHYWSYMRINVHKTSESKAKHPRGKYTRYGNNLV